MEQDDYKAGHVGDSALTAEQRADELFRLAVNRATEIAVLEQKNDELETECAALREQIADCHDIIGKLWSAMDPEVEAELMPHVHRILGVDDPNGDCGNPICKQLAESEATVTALVSALRDLSAQHEGWQHGMGPCVCEAHEAARKLLATLDPPLVRQKEKAEAGGAARGDRSSSANSPLGNDRADR